MSEKVKMETNQTNDEELTPSIDTLKKIYDYACRNLEHRDSGAYEEAHWAANELIKLGINPDTGATLDE